MGTNRRTLEEQIAETQRLLEAEQERVKAYLARMRGLKTKKRNEDNKARTHRLVGIGASCEHVLGMPITEEMLPRLIDWLESQERKGKYFSRALGITNSGDATADEGESPVTEGGRGP